MVVMARNVARQFGSLVLSLTAGCGLFGEDDPSISLAATPSAVVLLQAATSPVTLEIGRTNFDKPVTLAVDGALPAGVTATFTPNPVPAGTATTALTIATTGVATPGTFAVTIKATGEGVADKSILIDVTVNVRGSHSVALSSSAVTVAAGGGGQTTVLLARQNNNAGNVTLTATGAPAGVTVSFGESPTTASATSVTVAATGSVAPGSYNVSIAGTQPGVGNPSPATLAVTVVAAPATTSMTIPFCAGEVPAWFAYQNDGFLWQRVTPSGNSFTFSATDKLGIAYYDAGVNSVHFYLATRSELSGLSDRDCGTKNHSGTTSNAGTQGAIVTLGPAISLVSNNAFALQGVPDRPLDLLAARGTIVGSLLTPDRLVIRRGVNLANNASIPVIDYLGAESVAPVSNTLTIEGLEAGETVYSENAFRATTWTYGLVYATDGSTSTQTMYSVPASSLVPGDISELYIDAFNSSSTVAHTMLTWFTTPSNRTETLGPLLTTPTVTVAATAPYVRERGQLPSQTAYPTVARFVFLQNPGKFVYLVVTAAHLGGVPATWDATVPDVSGVAGFNTTWMHSPGQTTAYSAEAFLAPGSTFFGGLPTIGQSMKYAYRQSTVATSVGSALRAATAQRQELFERRRGVLNPRLQYLRR
jgi:hypothetical protein